MLPKGLILAVSLGIIAGPIFGIILFDIGTQEQLVYADGTSLSIVTEKINFKLGEEVVIKIINSGTDELKFSDTSYGLVIKQLDSIPIYIPTSTQEISKLQLMLLPGLQEYQVLQTTFLELFILNKKLEIPYII